MSALDLVEQKFALLAFASIDNPYNYISNNYQNYILLLKNSDPETNKAIINMLRTGYNYCSIWDNDQMSEHFVNVYNAITDLQTDIASKK